MIHRFRQVVKNTLYRGSAPSPKDVLWLKNNLGIKKIVSLDEKIGNRIDRITKLLNIKHVIAPINGRDRLSLLRFLKHNLHKLFLEDGPTYVHCLHGKDRTGLAVALVKCKYLGMSPDKAIEEAKSLGFGVGLSPHIVHLYEKIIRSCHKEQNDESELNAPELNAPALNQFRENKSSVLDESDDKIDLKSFAPFLDITRQYPADNIYDSINDQYPTRENYNNDALLSQPANMKVPFIGQYNAPGGFGPVENYGRYFQA